MRMRVFGTVLVLSILFSVVGCRGMGGQIGNGQQFAPMSVVIADTPPNGVTVLSLLAVINNITVQPGNVAVLTQPATVDLALLQAHSTFLVTTSVPVGIYSSATIQFANVLATFLNKSGGPIGLCANGSVCQVGGGPSLSTVTLNSAPFPLTLAANTPFGLRIDVDFTKALDLNLAFDGTVSGAVTATVLPSVQLTQPLAELDDVLGVVAGIGTNQFTLTASNGSVYSVQVNSGTAFDFSESQCAANNFTCLAANQVVTVDLAVLGNGSFVANQLTLEDSAGAKVIEGAVLSLGAGAVPKSFTMLVHRTSSAITGVSTGAIAAVSLQQVDGAHPNGTAFAVNADGLTVPGTLNFASAADLTVGQEILVRYGASSSGLSVNTDRASLHMSDLSALVFLVNLGNASFTINNLPSLYSPNNSPLDQIDVLTSANTDFSGLTPPALSSLANGNGVSVRGLLFSTPGGAVPLALAARNVVGRPTT